MCPTSKILPSPAGGRKYFFFLTTILLVSGCLGPVGRGPRSSLSSVTRLPGASQTVKKKSVDLASAHPMFSPPLKTFRVRSPYGLRGRKRHTGVDLVGSPKGGDPVLSSMAGTVETVSHRGGYGRMVLIRHGDKGFTRYAHLQKITVQQGKSVHQGETVGFVGKSGRATGYHLHFEILTAEHKTLDPLPFLFPEVKSVQIAGPSTPALPSSIKLLPTIPVPQNVK